MDRKEFDALEIEANGITTPAQNAQRKAEVLRINYAEKMAELLQDCENGQNYGARFPGYTPINMLR